MKATEDYLETIYQLKEEKGKATVKEISQQMKVSLPSVTEMMQKLATKDLVIYQKYNPIQLTKKGKIIAQKVAHDHDLLTRFFMSLGVDKKTASVDACHAEHILSKRTLNKIKEFVRKE